jgi:TRAP transporter 4TM/12TM fusion protein
MLENKRTLTGYWALLAGYLSALLPVSTIIYALQLLPKLGIVIYKEQFLMWFLTLSLVLTFLIIPPLKNKASTSDAVDVPGQVVGRVPWYDIILALIALTAGSYVTFWYHQILPEIGVLTTDKILASAAGILLLLEATRRHLGWTMVSLALVALAYSYFGSHLGGILETRVIRFDRLLVYNYLGQDAIHGTPLFVAGTVVTAFMLFGQMLFATGGGQAISDFGFALMGRYRGGPAKVSIVASGLFGSLSGSASANVATTGMITIPMIREAGYPAHKAAAIEAVASTGGLILPPIMAATGFIMAEFLGIPYAEVAVAALLPALLYYLCLFIQVDLEAAASGITGLAEDKIPPRAAALKSVAPVAIPVAVLLFMLFYLFQSPETSALYATVAVILVSLGLPRMRQKFLAYCKVLVKTGDAVVSITIICAIAGLIIGCLGLTGLGTNLSQALVMLANGEVWLLLVLAAVASIILGMGVPVTATYIILVILLAPALVELGIPELAAHLFLFYFGTLSFLTPPVCISVFVAAALAQADVMKTALFAMRLAVVAYLLPFFFVFNQSFLLEGTWDVLLRTGIGAVGSIMLLSAGLAGYFRGHLSWWARILVVAAGLAGLKWGIYSWLGVIASYALIAILYKFGKPATDISGENTTQ